MYANEWKFLHAKKVWLLTSAHKCTNWGFFFNIYDNFNKISSLRKTFLQQKWIKTKNVNTKIYPGKK